jgi:hypothetical protein
MWIAMLIPCHLLKLIQCYKNQWGSLLPLSNACEHGTRQPSTWGKLVICTTTTKASLSTQRVWVPIHKVKLFLFPCELSSWLHNSRNAPFVGKGTGLEKHKFMQRSTVICRRSLLICRSSVVKACSDISLYLKPGNKFFKVFESIPHI